MCWLFLTLKSISPNTHCVRTKQRMIIFLKILSLPYFCSSQWHVNKTCPSNWNICYLSVHVLLASRLLGAFLPRHHPKYDNKNDSPKDHLWLYARHPQLPPSLFHFHSYPSVLEGVASEGASSDLEQLRLFSVESTCIQCMPAFNFWMVLIN